MLTWAPSLSLQNSQTVCAAADLTQVSKERQVIFDKLPVPAPGLKTSDSQVKHLMSLAQAPCSPFTSNQLGDLKTDVRYTHCLWLLSCRVGLPSLAP